MLLRLIRAPLCHGNEGSWGSQFEARVSGRYAWLLIAIGIVIVIAACVYVWWLLSSRRKQREKQAKMSESCEGAGEGSSERGLISGVAPATGYIDDDAATATVTGIGVSNSAPRLITS